MPPLLAVPPARAAAALARSVGRLCRRADRSAAETAQRYRSLFEHTPDAVYSFDLQGKYTSMNPAGRELVGDREVLGRSFVEVVHPDDLERVREHFAQALAGVPQSYTCRAVSAGGEVVVLQVTNSAIVVGGEVVGVFGVAKDITAQVHDQRRLHVAKQRYQALYDRNPDPVYSQDREGRFVGGNRACQELTGFEPGRLQGVALEELVDAPDRRRARAQFRRALNGEPSDYPCTIVRADGTRAHLRVLNIPIVVDGEVVGVYGVAKDVTERHRLEGELRRQARSDALTLLPNRLELLERLAARLECGDVWLLFVDLDRFKVVNDSLGHAAGDELLRALVVRVGDALRADDLVVRFGGDEFCVVLAPGTTGPQAELVAGRVRDVVRPAFRVGGTELYVTASVGVAHAERGEAPDECLRRADIAMYAAKAAGRDQVSTYAPGGSEAARSQLSLETELRRALAGDELVLHHQPQLRLDAGGRDEVVGVESLVRWQHPQRGLLAPDEFLPAVHAAGLSLALDLWVLRAAVRAAAGWTGAAGLGVSVNVSPDSLLAPAFGEAVDAVLAETSLGPQRLTVEITENAVLAEADRVRTVLAGLRARGVRVALDDFGTGWSSLAYLERFPVDVLKIDREFVRRTSAGTPAPVVDAILSLARALDLRTVAEGVETVEQRSRLLAAGCEEFQGFLVARPLTADALLALLAERAGQALAGRGR